MELLANFGASERMKRIAKQSILDIFSGKWPGTGDESNYIGEVCCMNKPRLFVIFQKMEKHFGGAWMVAIFVSFPGNIWVKGVKGIADSVVKDIDFDAAYTIVRRSPSYLLYGVNNRAILIAREGNGRRRKGENPILI
jgi:hypothetical protein